MILKYYGDVYPYYLRKVRETAEGMTQAVMLKTDAWNEVRLDIDGTGPIIGQIPGVEKSVCVEKMESRAKELEGKIKCVVVAKALQETDFPEESFDLIVCLATINHMGFVSAGRVMKNFRKWLKRDGKMYLAVWLTSRLSRGEDSRSDRERIYHNSEDFKWLLDEVGFKVLEREEVMEENQSQMLVGYKCGV
jgi:SAM-dependent methyltransferase